MANIKHYNTDHIKLQWNTEKKTVRILCKEETFASRYLSMLIEQRKVGIVTGVIYSKKKSDRVVRIFRGKELSKFLNMVHTNRSFKTKTRFTDLFS